MREIKFRGMHYKNRSWVCGDLKRHSVVPDLIFIDTEHDGTIQVMPETVGQLTPFKDKNGKEIFEHDIVESKDFHNDYDNSLCVFYNVKSVVRWSDNLGAFITGDILLSDYLDTKEIIGNTHENPELLERTE